MGLKADTAALLAARHGQAPLDLIRPNRRAPSPLAGAGGADTGSDFLDFGARVIGSIIAPITDASLRGFTRDVAFQTLLADLAAGLL